MEVECLDEKYEGSYNRNARDGLGRQQWPDGDSYEGEFCKDHLHGFGIYKWADGGYYQGTLYMDEREGAGKQYNREHECLYEGLFRRNNFYGFGKVTYLSYDNDDENYNDNINEKNQPEIKTKLEEKHTKNNNSKMVSINCETDKKLNHAEDIGLWVGKKLVKIFNKNENFFVFGDTVLNISKETFKTKASNKDSFSQKLLNCFSENASDMESKLFIDQLPQSSFSINNHLFLQKFANHTSIKNPFFSDTINTLWFRKGALKSSDVSTNEDYHEGPQNNNDNILDAKSSSLNGNDQNKVENIENKFTNDVEEKKYEHNYETSNRIKFKTKIWNRTPILMKLQKNTLTYSKELVDICRKFEDFDLENGVFTGLIEKPGRLHTMSEALFERCIGGDVRKVKNLLDTKELYIDVADYYGNTPLFYAAAAGQNDIVQILLDRGSDITRLNDVCMNVIYLTCAVQYRPDIVVLRGNNQVDFNNEDFNKDFDNSNNAFSKVFETSEKRKIDYEKGLDKKLNGFDKENYNETNNNSSEVQLESDVLQIKRRKSPLKFKLCSDGLQVFEKNIKNGNVENQILTKTEPIYEKNLPKKIKKRKNEKKKSAKNEKVVKEDNLLKEPKKNYRSFDVVLEDGDKVENAKPCRTSRKDLTSTIKLLIRKGANVDPTNPRKIPSIISSPLSPQPSQSPSPQPSPPPSSLQPSPFLPPSSPLLMAIEVSDIHIVHTLLSHGADPNFTPLDPTRDQKSPIEVACSTEGPESVVICQKLLDAGADIKSNKLIEVVCMRNDRDDRISVKLLQLILSYINEPKAIDIIFSNHHSPLSYCINTRQLKMVDALLEKQANVNMSLNRGLTSALCVLIRNELNNWSSEEQILMLKRLITNGANVTCAVKYEDRVGTVVDLINSLYKTNSNLRIRGNELKKIVMQAMDPKNLKTPDRKKKVKGNLKSESANSVSHENDNKLSNGRESIQNEMLNQSEVASDKQLNGDWQISNKHEEILNMNVSNSSKNNENKLIGGRTKWDQNLQGKSVSRYCYNCGKSAGLKLFPCTKRRSVYYCGKLCMHIAWNKEHQHKCDILLSERKKRSAEIKKLSAQNNNANNVNAENANKVGWTKRKQRKNLENGANVENLEIIDTDWQSFYETYYQTDSKGLSKLAKEWKKEKKNFLKKDSLANSNKDIDNKLKNLNSKKMDISKINKKNALRSFFVKKKDELFKQFELQAGKELHGGVARQQGLFFGNYSYI